MNSEEKIKQNMIWREIMSFGVPDADILSFDDGIVNHISYEDTESYQVTEMFINRQYE